MPGLFDLTGKTVLVTGSSRGLGLTVARGLGMAGAKVILNGVNSDFSIVSIVSIGNWGGNWWELVGIWVKFFCDFKYLVPHGAEFWTIFQPTFLES